MSRARELARLGNENIASVDSTNERLGIGSEQPAKKLDVGGDLQVTGTTASTSTTTGAVTVSGGVGIAKSLFVGEGVSIAGTITYNDVTNIDSVGIVTAGKGLRATTGGLVVTAGNVKVTAGIASVGAGVTISSDFIHLTDNSKIQLGIASDLAIYHNGSHSVIQNATGSLLVEADSCVLRSQGQENYLVGNANGTVDIYHNGVAKFNTAGAGVSVTGGVQVSSGGTFGSHNANAAVYYGDGSNLTGIEGGPAGVNTTGFSTFKDISVQGISTFSNLTDATSTTAASLVLSGGVGVAKSIYLGQNLHIADGKGIDFFAAGGSTATGATRTSNVLDHYEEGTWDPVLNAGTTGAVSNYSYQDGFFVRIGGLLYVSFFVKGSSTSGLASGSGDLWVTGLPFAVSSFPNNTISVPDCQLAATDVDTSAYGWYITGEYYSDRFYIYYRSSTTNQGAMGGQCTATVSVACRTCVRCY